MNVTPRRVVFLGAGAIGCFLGAHWAAAVQAAGGRIGLIGRDATWAQIGAGPLRLTGGTAADTDLSLLDLHDSPEALSEADLIVLTLKSIGLERAIEEIRAYAAEGTPILCLLNGVSAVEQLGAALPAHPVIAGMVPFNVVWASGNHLHRSSAGQLKLERTPVSTALAEIIAPTGAPAELQDALKPIQYGKLLLNLINPINALSGLPLHAMLCQSGYRRIYAATLREALRVYDEAGVTWQTVGPLSPRLVQWLLRLPDALFNRTLLRLQKLDPASMTSMAVDLAAGRPTEIDAITGEILRLAASADCPAPINTALFNLIKAHEAAPTPQQGHSAAALAQLLRL